MLSALFHKYCYILIICLYECLLYVIASEQSERSNLKSGIASVSPRNDCACTELNKSPYL